MFPSFRERERVPVFSLIFIISAASTKLEPIFPPHLYVILTLTRESTAYGWGSLVCKQTKYKTRTFLPLRTLSLFFHELCVRCYIGPFVLVKIASATTNYTVTSHRCDILIALHTLRRQSPVSCAFIFIISIETNVSLGAPLIKGNELSTPYVFLS
jgi:hypothetical protein